MARIAAILIWLMMPNKTALPEPYQQSGQETPFQIYDDIEQFNLPEDFRDE